MALFTFCLCLQNTVKYGKSNMQQQQQQHMSTRAPDFYSAELSGNSCIFFYDAISFSAADAATKSLSLSFLAL
jgi:hypothetical protein